jgi:trimeric autotransporter adhesin
MSLILNGTDGLSDVDGSAATPAIRGTDANTGIFFPAADTIAFSEGGAEAMRIDSSSNLLVGTTNSSLGRIAVSNAGTTAPAVYAQNNSGASGAKGYLSDIPSTSNNTSSYHFAGLTQSVGFFYLYGNGTSSWTSDERKKKNIQTTRDGYLDDLMNLRVVKYNWINQENNEPKELGLIAQEVEKVFPGLVQDALHADIDGTTYKVFKGSVLPYMLLKAIQELKAELDTVKAELATLKGAA